jgi:predicted RNase H-like nuclease (RuvC/YqgF family)
MDANVKQEDIEAIEKEISSKEKLREEILRKEVEAKVKADLAKEKELEDMRKKIEEYEAEKAKIAEEKAKYEDNLRKQKEQHETELKQLKSQIGSTKQIYTPSQKSDGKPNFENVENTTLDEIEKASRDAFFNYVSKDRQR